LSSTVSDAYASVPIVNAVTRHVVINGQRCLRVTTNRQRVTRHVIINDQRCLRGQSPFVNAVTRHVIINGLKQHQRS